MNSRYYDSETGRFISPDTLSILDETLSQINGLNLYLYCNDNPVMFVDPSGKIAITTIILLVCIGIGAVAGFGGAVCIDYKDDGQIFNGSVAWYDYLGATVLGGVIGGLVGYSIAPVIAGLLTSTGVVGGGLALAGGLGTIGGTIAISTIGELALVGTIAAVGAGTFGVTVMFAKGGLPNNKHQNQQWAEAMRQLGIENRDLWRRLHIEIQKYPYSTHDNLRKLIKLLKEILKKWGKL